MDFPIDHLLDEQACYDQLLALLHPQGLSCPNGHALAYCSVHKRERKPVLNYRCRQCGRCFNALTDTMLEGIRYTPSQIMQMLRGFSQGTSTAQLAREMGVDRPHLLSWRHRMQDWAAQARPELVLAHETTEADEMYQNAGEKRREAF